MKGASPAICKDCPHAHQSIQRSRLNKEKVCVSLFTSCVAYQVKKNGLQISLGMQAATKQLQELLERELVWDLTASDLAGETDDEDAPVVVEL